VPISFEQYPIGEQDHVLMPAKIRNSMLEKLEGSKSMLFALPPFSIRRLNCTIIHDIAR
jgi:hypothetical protein